MNKAPTKGTVVTWFSILRNQWRTGEYIGLASGTRAIGDYFVKVNTCTGEITIRLSALEVLEMPF